MYYAVEADGAKIKFNDGHWKNIKLEGCVGDSEYFFEFDPNETKAYVPLSAEDIAHLTDPSILDWGGSMFINGQNVTLNKIELEIELPQEKDIAGLSRPMPEQTSLIRLPLHGALLDRLTSPRNC
jgi:hypothetical protein